MPRLQQLWNHERKELMHLGFGVSRCRSGPTSGSRALFPMAWPCRYWIHVRCTMGTVWQLLIIPGLPIPTAFGAAAW